MSESKFDPQPLFVSGFENLLTQVATGSYIDVMRAVGIKVLKNKLSEYVRLAEHGETVLVTDRDRVAQKSFRLIERGVRSLLMP